jgi:F-type H+-transporting ATPase subunit b
MWKASSPRSRRCTRSARQDPGRHAEGEAAQAEAEAALAEYKRPADGARDEAARIREDAKTQGAAIIADMRQQATEESSRMLVERQGADRGRARSRS